MWLSNTLSDFIVSHSVFMLLVVREMEAITFNLCVSYSHRYNPLTMFSSAQRRCSSTNNFPSAHCPLLDTLRDKNQLKWNKISTKQPLMPVLISKICFFRCLITEGNPSWDYYKSGVSHSWLSLPKYTWARHKTPLCCRAPLDPWAPQILCSVSPLQSIAPVKVPWSIFYCCPDCAVYS